MKKILALFVAAGLGSATGLSGAEPGFPSPSEKDATPRAGLSGVTFRLFEGDWKTLPDLDGLAPAHSGVLLSNRVDLSPLGAQGGMKCVFDLAPGQILKRWESPAIAGRPFVIHANIQPASPDGVILAHGGYMDGYALHLDQGRLVLSLISNRKRSRVSSEQLLPLNQPSVVTAQVKLDGTLLLQVNGEPAGQAVATELPMRMPFDGLSVGRDTGLPMYKAKGENPFEGVLKDVRVVLGGAALVFSGNLQVASAGPHQFHLHADGATRLEIDSQVVIDNSDSSKSSQSRGTADLAAGPHQFRLTYAQLQTSQTVSGKATPPRVIKTTDKPWIEDRLPAGVIFTQGEFEFVSEPEPVYSGARSLKLSAPEKRSVYFNSDRQVNKDIEPVFLAEGDRFYAYAYLDPQDPPEALEMAWHDSRGWEHRAYWGQNLFDGHDQRHNTQRLWPMGPLPPVGKWARLEVPALAVGYAPDSYWPSIHGWGFQVAGGTVYYDQAGVASPIIEPASNLGRLRLEWFGPGITAHLLSAVGGPAAPASSVLSADLTGWWLLEMTVADKPVARLALKLEQKGTELAGTAQRLGAPSGGAFIKGRLLLSGAGKAPLLNLQHAEKEADRLTVFTAPLEEDGSVKLGRFVDNDRRAGTFTWTRTSEAKVAAMMKPKEPAADPARDWAIIEQAIRLQLNKPKGALTPEDYRKVKGLDLQAKGITDITPLARLTELETLMLSYNKIEELKALKGLVKLKRLHLGDNRVVDIRPLAGMKRMEWLYLEKNKIRDAKVLAEMKALKGIDLSGNLIPPAELDRYRRMLFMAAPSPGDPSKLEINPLHELTLAEVSSHRGTGGLDPGAQVEPALLMKDAATKPFPFGASYHLEDKRWFNGFYFMGQGKILPECAMRIYLREQMGIVRSEKRGGSWTDKHWSGPADCSALAWMVRVDQGIMLRANVRDDKFMTTDTEDLWLNDSLEVFFDVRHNDQGKGAYERGVFQMLLSPKKDGTVAVWFKGIEVPGVAAKCWFVKDGWRVQAFIPLKELEAKHFFPVNAFNFELIVNDSDTLGDRDTTMMWSGSELAFFDARRFGHMRSLRRGRYFEGDKDALPPPGARLKVDHRFNARIRCQDWKRATWRAGGGTWASPQDCSAEAWLRRGEDGLHFHIDVIDDKVVTGHKQPWNQDGVELYLDLRPDGQRGRAVPGYDPGTGGAYKEPPGLQIPGVIQVHCPLPKGGGTLLPEFGRYLHTRKPTTPKNNIPGTTVHSKITATGYSMDIFLPYTGLKVNHRVPGKQFNFDFVVNDADSPKGRDTAFTWAGWLLNYQNPAAWARMKPLVPGEED